MRPAASLQILPGLALICVLALAAIFLGQAPWFQKSGISALTFAIVLGMILGNTAYPHVSIASTRGVTFCKQILLRIGIIFYGLRLTFQDVAHVGLAGVIIDLLVLASTFALSWWAGTRLFGLDRQTAMLIGAGSAICGAAAVMAAQPVVRGRPEQAAVAVSTVVLFGTLAIFLYPALFELNARHHFLSMSARAYGIFAGSTIHEVAQVLAAGRAVADGAADIAVITKMVRVMMLAPFLILLSAYVSRRPEAAEAKFASSTSTRRVLIPWFALWFVAVVILNSLIALPHDLKAAAIDLDTFLLAMAMAALGVSTQISAVRTAGIKPLALAAMLFAWLIFAGFAINAGVRALLS